MLICEVAKWRYGTTRGGAAQTNQTNDTPRLVVRRITAHAHTALESDDFNFVLGCLMSIKNSYLLVLATVALTVYGQIVIKWQVSAAHSATELSASLPRVIAGWLTNLWILSALFSAFLASITWMLAMRSLPLSRGYPLMSLTFVLVVMAGSVLFQEHISLTQVLGMALIVGGVSLVALH